MIVTFDLFSALTDSRTGASRFFAELVAERGWLRSGEEVYDAWDRHNKALQLTARPPETFHELSGRALAAAYSELGLARDGVDEGEIDSDLARLEQSLPSWPLWPDVVEAVGRMASVVGVGILSNVDEDIVTRTRAHLLVDTEMVLTSQRLGAYKPDPAIYRRAAELVSPEPLVHVATSARDVRGALEAGITTIRLVRPGHRLDPEGPRPVYEAADAAEVADLVALLAQGEPEAENAG